MLLLCFVEFHIMTHRAIDTVSSSRSLGSSKEWIKNLHGTPTVSSSNAFHNIAIQVGEMEEKVFQNIRGKLKRDLDGMDDLKNDSKIFEQEFESKLTKLNDELKWL